MVAASWEWQWRQLGGNMAAEVAAPWQRQRSSGSSVAAAAWQHGGGSGSTAVAVAAAVLCSNNMAA